MNQGILFGLAAGALWGLAFIVPKVLGGFSTESVALGRFGFCALAAAFALARTPRELPILFRRRQVIWGAWLAVLGSSAYFLLLVQAVREAGVAITAIIVGALPVTIAIAGARSARELRHYLPSIACIALGILVAHGWDFQPADATRRHGIWLALAAHAFWLVFAVQNARFLKRTGISPKLWSSALGIWSFVLLVVFFAIERAPIDLGVLLQSPTYIFWSSAVGIASSWVANWFWNETSQRLSEALAGQLLVSETVFGILYECVYDARSPHGSELLALALLVAGVAIALGRAPAPRISQAIEI